MNNLQDTKNSQPEQEPVAWLYFHNRAEPQLDVQLEEPDCIKSFPDDVVWKKPLYTTPPQRTWVGLTDEDIKEAEWLLSAIKEHEAYTLQEQLLVEGVDVFARAIEAKLKEKNT